MPIFFDHVLIQNDKYYQLGGSTMVLEQVSSKVKTLINFIQFFTIYNSYHVIYHGLPPMG